MGRPQHARIRGAASSRLAQVLARRVSLVSAPTRPSMPGIEGKIRPGRPVASKDRARGCQPAARCRSAAVTATRPGVEQAGWR